MAANVTVSERATRRIGEILKGEGAGAMLRVSVEGGGCGASRCSPIPSRYSRGALRGAPGRR